MAVPGAPDTWVPVDRRWLGMDRRALTPALIVAVFTVISVWLLPALDKATQNTDLVRAGDVIRVGDAVAFSPAVGWTVGSGLRTSSSGATGFPPDAQVSKGAVSFSLSTGKFAGTPRELLAQLRRNNERFPKASAARLIGQPVTFTTSTGQSGVLTKFSNGPAIGFVAALVIDGTGVETVASGPDTIDNATESQIVSMFESIRPLAQSEKRGR